MQMKRLFIVTCLACLCFILATQKLLGQQLPVSAPIDSLVVSTSEAIYDSAHQNRLNSFKQTECVFVRRIVVKAGDSINLSAKVFDRTNYKSRFWKSLAKAVIPSIFAKSLINRHITQADQRVVNTATSVEASVAVVPGLVESVSHAKNSQTYIKATVYNSNGEPVSIVGDRMTKAARKDWEELQAGYRIKEDGYVDITGVQAKSRDLLFETDNKHNWIRVGKHIQNAPVNPDQSPVAADDTLQNTTNDTPSAMASAYSCTAWYWCTQFGCEYLGTQCNVDEGPPPGDGGDNGSGGYDDCRRKCDAAAQKRSGAKQIADAALFAAMAACFGTSIEFSTTVLAAVSPTALLGPEAPAIIAGLFGVAYNATCMTAALWAYSGAYRMADADYVLDTSGCNCN